MALATVDADGMPNVRMVLLKGFDAQSSRRGFVFYTNFESAKGAELLGRARRRCASTGNRCAGRCACAAPCRAVSDAEADAYFATRPRGSRIGAWASQQSRPLESRFALEKAVAAYTARYPIGDIPRPPYWSGFRITPARDRVLARPAVPPARPRAVPAGRAGRGVEENPALPLSHGRQTAPTMYER